MYDSDEIFLEEVQKILQVEELALRVEAASIPADLNLESAHVLESIKSGRINPYIAKIRVPTFSCIPHLPQIHLNISLKSFEYYTWSLSKGLVSVILGA
jgi:hypothetical protein